MKTIDQLKPNYAPLYAAALYPELAAIFQKHGYALAVYGSLVRDFDLLAVAWVENISSPQVVLDEITKNICSPYCWLTNVEKSRASCPHAVDWSR